MTEEEEEKELFVDCELDQDQDDVSDGVESPQSTSSPLVLEPLGMCISFDETASGRVEQHDYEQVPQNNELHDFFVLWRYPIIVYTVCFIVPAISSYVMQEDTLERLQEWYNYIRYVYANFSFCGSACEAWKNQIRQDYLEPALEYVCNLDNEYTYSNWDYEGNTEVPWDAYKSITYWAHRFNLCPPPVEEEAIVIQYRPVVAPDAVVEWKHDLVIIGALGTTLTILRMLIIWISTSLSKESAIDVDDDTDPIDPVETFVLAMETHPDRDSFSRLDESIESDASHVSTITATFPEATFMDAPETEDDQCAFDYVLVESPSDPLSAEPLPETFFLPGSAFFQAVCCTTSATFAWRWFHTADFWPDFLLGQGELQHCWDLVVLDEEHERIYQEQDTQLRYYILIQASFCIVRFVRWLLRRRRTTTTLIMSLIQSVPVLGLLALAYSFSSLRRIMAIGMFSLDASSALRNLWQMSVPSLGASGIRNAIARLLYWGLVLPSFVVTRFYVYPVLWQSATSEDSEEWRIHLEQAFWKGSADQFVRLCDLCLIMLLLVSVFSLRRLIQLGPLLRSSTTRDSVRILVEHS